MPTPKAIRLPNCAVIQSSEAVVARQTPSNWSAQRVIPLVERLLTQRR
jgi:hypothetical protein